MRRERMTVELYDELKHAYRSRWPRRPYRWWVPRWAYAYWKT